MSLTRNDVAKVRLFFAKSSFPVKSFVLCVFFLCLSVFVQLNYLTFACYLQ